MDMRLVNSTKAQLKVMIDNWNGYNDDIILTAVQTKLALHRSHQKVLMG